MIPLLFFSICTMVAQQSTSKVIDFGPTPSVAQAEEIKVLNEKLFHGLQKYYKNAQTELTFSKQDGWIKITSGTTFYDQQNPTTKLGNVMRVDKEEGPFPGGFLLRCNVRMCGQLESRPRCQIFDRVYGQWFYMKVSIPNTPYEIAYDYITSENEAASKATKLRKTFTSIILQKN